MGSHRGCAVEAFKGRLRAEYLDENWFMSLDDARARGSCSDTHSAVAGQQQPSKGKYPVRGRDPERRFNVFRPGGFVPPVRKDGETPSSGLGGAGAGSDVGAAITLGDNDDD